MDNQQSMSDKQYNQTNYFLTQSQFYSSSLSDTQSSSSNPIDLRFNNNHFQDTYNQSSNINQNYNDVHIEQNYIQRDDLYKNSFSYASLQNICSEMNSNSINKYQDYKLIDVPRESDNNELNVDQLNQENKSNETIQQEEQTNQYQLALVPQQRRLQCGIINKPISKQHKKIKRNSGSEESSDIESDEQNSNNKESIQDKSSSQIYLNYKQKLSGNINSSKKRKKFQVAQILKNVVIDNSFLIPGQIIVNTQFDQGYRNVYMNSNIYQSAKKVERVIYNKERETFESHFSTQFSGLTDFEFIIKLLESKQNQQIYEQAQVLKFYQQFIKTHQQVIKGIQDSGVIDQELFIKNTQNFLQKGDEIVSKMPKDCIYIYFYNRINYSKGSYEELRFGFNKGLSAIVGLDDDEAVQFSNQMLILCMMTPESQLKYYMNVLQSEMSGQTWMNVDYQQYTYEGMEITLTTKQQIYHFPGQFSPKDFSLRILEIEPDALTLQQIIQERNKNGLNNKYNDSQNSFKKEEFDRYKAGLQFLEEFYERKSAKKTNKQPLRCDFVVKEAPQITSNLNTIDPKPSV